MQHIQGISRDQMRFSSLEDAIAADNQIRFIDAFVVFLIMLVYNIKRSANILGVSELIAKLKKWNSPYKAKVLF